MPEDGDNDDFGSSPTGGTGSKKGKAPRLEDDESRENAEEKESKNDIQWGLVSKNLFTTIGPSSPTLEPGAYSLEADQEGRIYFRKEELKTDELLEFKDSITDDILKEIETFWNNQTLFKQYNFLHRRGYLFYGGAGGGKTSMVQLIIKRIMERGGIVFFGNHPALLNKAVRTFRNIESNRHIVCIFEDIDAIIDARGESELLSFLDGENQVDDVLNIATTNYPERLDRRIICRPRRFDRRIKILPPSDSIRTEFFMRKLGLVESEIQDYVLSSKNFTFAGMADLVIQTKCLLIPFDEAVKRITNLLDKNKPSSDEDSSKVGFS